jgi:hypothetical protein
MNQFVLSKEQQELLRAQVIDAAHPGPILRDFQTLLDFVGPQGVKAPGKYNLLPLGAIGELNERLSRPLRLDLKRPQLRSHPYLQGLHLLLRATGLGRAEQTGPRARLGLDPLPLERWNGLNSTERYFTLLEAWLRIGRPEMVGERGGSRFGGFLYSCLETWSYIPPEGARYDTARPQDVYLFGIGRSFYLLALMDLFGLLEVQHPPVPVKPWCPAGVTHVPFGDAVFTLLGQHALYPWEQQDDEDGFGRWQGLFQPYFPEWQNNLVLPPVEFRPGVFVFLVSLGRAKRQIAMPAKASLDKLASWILRSVDFDHDHLYEFIYRDRRGAEIRVHHPFTEESPSTSDVQVGDLPLEPGQTMTFVFDFGDNWHFDVRLERIDPPGTKTKAPRFVQKQGQAPQQYGNWNG